jgi:hypothetical protein
MDEEALNLLKGIFFIMVMMIVYTVLKDFA